MAGPKSTDERQRKALQSRKTQVYRCEDMLIPNDGAAGCDMLNMNGDCDCVCVDAAAVAPTIVGTCGDVAQMAGLHAPPPLILSAGVVESLANAARASGKLGGVAGVLAGAHI